jgi:hypothetical protein
MSESNQTNAGRELLKVILGAVGLFFMCGLTIVITNAAGKALEAGGIPHPFQLFLTSLVVTACFFIIAFTLVKLVEWPILTKLGAGTNALSSAASDYKKAASDYKTVSSKTNDLMKEVNNTLDKSNKQQNVGQNVLFGNYADIQKDFLLSVEGRAGKTVTVLGTMLGTFGKNSVSFAKQLNAHCVNGQKNCKPFAKAFFCVPGHKTTTKVMKHDARCLYPISARIAAAETLIEFSQSQSATDLQSSLKGGNLIIEIRFVNRLDIFPAIQLWEKDHAMIICSTGANDRFSDRQHITSISKSMKVAMVIKKHAQLYEGKTDMSDSLARIHNMIEKDYLNSRLYERWVLHGETNRISIQKFRELKEKEAFLHLANSRYEDKSNHADLMNDLTNAFTNLKDSSKEFKPDELQTLINIIKKATGAIASKESIQTDNS